jgi:hypothetical protein
MTDEQVGMSNGEPLGEGAGGRAPGEDGLVQLSRWPSRPGLGAGQAPAGRGRWPGRPGKPADVEPGIWLLCAGDHVHRPPVSDFG